MTFQNKTLIGAKPLHVRFNKLGIFIIVYDGTRYLVLFGPENITCYIKYYIL